ncbi:hypothetical protein MPSI1_001052 [Malassezia psittaci]|uniref:C2H2-type domain-containing protein n=1 Tax=Malassezia psittaci TaxID=1821823 RepID=A0AAF0F9J3_9BASI|nr:hypothetical protein MPSI1_001052 [Malassezia psittaci]
MADYMESAPPAPPASYQASVENEPKKESRAHPDAHDDEPPMKSAKHSNSAYAAKPAEDYSTIDFLGNVSGGPHAAAAEALATFSSSVGSENTGNANMFVHVPQHASPSPNVPNSSNLPNPSHNVPSGASAPHGPPFLCPTCNTSYSRLEYLRRHERRHADIRPFTCVCGKSFSRSDVLARHKTKCRVVLAGEAEAPSERKSERRSNAPRATRTRAASQSANKSDREEMGDLSVDPALSNAVDLSMQPPPPLEGEAQHGDTEHDSYAFGGASNYAHHYASIDGEQGGQAGKPNMSYTGAQGNGNGMTHRAQHDPKNYQSHGSSTPPIRGGSFVSGSAAIHPELSRNANVYNHNGSHTPNSTNGANSPNSNPSASSPFYSHTDAPVHASYLSSNLRESDVSASAPNANANNNASPYPIGKEPARYSVPASGPLSPFSNTALNSTMSPYLSAFSCARDIPHSSSSRTSASGPSSTIGTNAANANDMQSSAPNAPAPPSDSEP